MPSARSDGATGTSAVCPSHTAVALSEVGRDPHLRPCTGQPAQVGGGRRHGRHGLPHQKAHGDSTVQHPQAQRHGQSGDPAVGRWAGERTPAPRRGRSGRAPPRAAAARRESLIRSGGRRAGTSASSSSQGPPAAADSSSSERTTPYAWERLCMIVCSSASSCSVSRPTTRSGCSGHNSPSCSTTAPKSFSRLHGGRAGSVRVPGRGDDRAGAPAGVPQDVPVRLLFRRRETQGLHAVHRRCSSGNRQRGTAQATVRAPCSAPGPGPARGGALSLEGSGLRPSCQPLAGPQALSWDRDRGCDTTVPSPLVDVRPLAAANTPPPPAQSAPPP